MSFTDITETDRLLTRVIAAIQSETKLGLISLEGLKALLGEISSSCREAFLLEKGSDLGEVLERLERAGFVAVDRTNPHVTVAFKGVLVCGPLSIPEPLKRELGEKIEVDALR